MQGRGGYAEERRYAVSFLNCFYKKIPLRTSAPLRIHRELAFRDLEINLHLNFC
jgi:hypothetical protein